MLVVLLREGPCLTLPLRVCVYSNKLPDQNGPTTNGPQRTEHNGRTTTDRPQKRTNTTDQNGPTTTRTKTTDRPQRTDHNTDRSQRGTDRTKTDRTQRTVHNGLDHNGPDLSLSKDNNKNRRSGRYRGVKTRVTRPHRVFSLLT